MPKCCFLSTDDLSGQILDDDLTHGPLNDWGWSVETIPWRDKIVDWNDFDVVVIRT